MCSGNYSPSEGPTRPSSGQNVLTDFNNKILGHTLGGSSIEFLIDSSDRWQVGSPGILPSWPLTQEPVFYEKILNMIMQEAIILPYAA